MKQKPSVYLETSFISYLTGDPSRNLTTLQRQISSREWWESHRQNFTLMISQAVIDECEQGDERVARRRRAFLAEAAVLDTTAAAAALAAALVQPHGPLPANARVDGVHIAVASVEACQYLLTWNLRHIANPYIRRMIDNIIREYAYEPPVVATADQLIEGSPR
ncbi:DNA-binding protein [Candidatus Sulfopaludibacter sp. SbA3]|nr:DNA-binding protein [Candidatus Sulfopaludibacter sp. SbA3]